jgi:hypothetical protein
VESQLLSQKPWLPQLKELSYSYKPKMLTKDLLKVVVKNTLVLLTVSLESQKKKVLSLYGEVIWLMSSDISQLKLLTLLSRIPTRKCSVNLTQKQKK